MATAASSGAWLLIDCGASSPVALPVPRQACLGLTRAVLFRGDDESRVAEAVRRCGAGDLSDSTIDVWLAAGERLPGRPGASLARRLAETLVLADDMHSGRAAAARFVDAEAWRSLAGSTDGGASTPARLLDRIRDGACAACSGPPPVGGAPADEALVLREAVQAAAALEACEGRFQEAVAEARLAAMRELAYGAGHEINNPLANIATRAQALLLEEADPERRRRLSTIVDQAFRARDMIGGLMLFARPPKPRPAEADVGTVVAAVIEATQPLAAARSARVEYSPPPAPVAAWIDRPQMEEAVRAIVVNALEAVEPGGRVVLAVRVRAGGDDPRLPAEAACEISVIDDGHGMDDDTLRRACDPFFSGREAGRGAGLGLSKAWRLIGANGGELKLESRPGQGTRVAVILPAR